MAGAAVSVIFQKVVAPEPVFRKTGSERSRSESENLAI